jgi:hypothetical protein
VTRALEDRAPAHFFVAGFQRCGSTWLARMLDDHPEIALAKPLRPEPKVFLDEDSGAIDPAAYDARWFADVPETVWCRGEKSVSYSEREGVPARIQRVFPDARVIMILRDPVERAISNWRFSTENGAESLPFAEALEREDERSRSFVPGRYASNPWAYVQRGLYAAALASWIEMFGRERLHGAVFENLRNDPGAIAGLLDFLDVASDATSPLANSRVNASQTSVAIARDTRDALQERFAAPNQLLARELGLDLSAWAGVS